MDDSWQGRVLEHAPRIAPLAAPLRRDVETEMLLAARDRRCRDSPAATTVDHRGVQRHLDHRIRHTQADMGGTDRLLRLGQCPLDGWAIVGQV